MAALLVTCRLAAPLAGDAPALDALLEYQLSLFHGERAAYGEPGYKIDRRFPAPPQGEIPIPVLRRQVTGGDGRSWLVACCSAPILSLPLFDGVEHVAKRIGVERAHMLGVTDRRVIATGNSWTKSYRLPLRVRRVERVCWFAVGERRNVLKVLRRCVAVGKKVADGYGRVATWEVETIGDDDACPCWFAPSDAGTVLMRPLPLHDRLPPGLVGARRDFGAPVPPYWHPDRYTEIVTPC